MKCYFWLVTPSIWLFTVHACIKGVNALNAFVQGGRSVVVVVHTGHKHTSTRQITYIF